MCGTLWLDHSVPVWQYVIIYEVLHAIYTHTCACVRVLVGQILRYYRKYILDVKRLILEHIATIIIAFAFLMYNSYCKVLLKCILFSAYLPFYSADFSEFA